MIVSFFKLYYLNLFSFSLHLFYRSFYRFFANFTSLNSYLVTLLYVSFVSPYSGIVAIMLFLLLHLAHRSSHFYSYLQLADLSYALPISFSLSCVSIADRIVFRANRATIRRWWKFRLLSRKIKASSRDEGDYRLGNFLFSRLADRTLLPYMKNYTREFMCFDLKKKKKKNKK